MKGINSSDGDGSIANREAAREDVNLCIGHPVWLFDENHRVYRKGPDGRGEGGVIWREHWCRYEIVAETRISWIVGRKHSTWHTEVVKLPKRAPRGKGWAAAVFSEAEVDQRAWIHDHAYKIGEKVSRSMDYGTLRQIAQLVGYAPALEAPPK